MSFCLPEPSLVCDQQLTAMSTVIPYQEPLSKGDNPELSSTLSQTLPMAAIFMRNRYIGWYVACILRHDSMPWLRRHLCCDRPAAKAQRHTQWRLTISDEFIGQPWFSASRTGWVRVKTARRAIAHRATSPSAVSSFRIQFPSFREKQFPICSQYLKGVVRLQVLK